MNGLSSHRTDPLVEYERCVTRAVRLMLWFPWLMLLDVILGASLRHVGIHGVLLILSTVGAGVVAAHAVILWPVARAQMQPSALGTPEAVGEGIREAA